MSHVAVIFDIIGSRELADRVGAQQRIIQALDEVNAIIPAHTEPWATVGDEFQAIYTHWGAAFRALLRIRLTLGPDLRLRAGVGIGNTRLISHGPRGQIHDGPGWIAARQALQDIDATAQTLPFVQHLVVCEDKELQASLVTQLLLLDHHFMALSARDYRVLADSLRGDTQREIAQREEISQAAVSQRLAQTAFRMLKEIDDQWTTAARDGGSA